MSYASSKEDVESDVKADSLGVPALSFDERFAAVDRKKLLRRIDIRIMPIICITYMVVRLDLNNISNAGTMNSETGHSLKQMLHLNAKQWAWVVSSFYYVYMAVEPVCTFMLKVTSPSVWISRIMISWGIVMACMAAVHNYGGVLACRILLGALEGSYFTSIIYSWAFWYSPAEMAPRVLLLYVANSSSGGFSGLFAYAVSFANGRLAGWQVLFILEGLLTIALGAAVYFILPDWPHTSKWMSPLEQEYVVAHLHRNAPKKTSKTWSTPEIVAMFADPTFWLFSLFWACYAVGAWGISTVLPFVVKDLGITDSAGTQLLQIPPAATGVAMCLISAYLIRKLKISAFAVTLAIVAGVLVSYIVFITVDTPGIRYAAVCVISGSCTAAYACLWPRRVAALRGTSAAALGIGLNNAISQFSGILGPQLWRVDYGPRYLVSAKAATAMVGANFVLVIMLWYLMEGDLSYMPRWISKRVLAQTQITEEDRVAALRGETVGEKR
ncbi:MFS general substrate transporter [Rhodotorula sp. JG-1b]|nr:MFS general substrate transporter [Rhodotorula sp. JG-1b]